MLQKHAAIVVLAIMSVSCKSPVLETFNSVREKSQYLKIGMTEDEVADTLGYRPGFTGIKSYGANTPGGGWTGLEWEFRWQMGYQLTSLFVVFARDQNGVWRMNHYNWS
jgi:hypothetical protein